MNPDNGQICVLRSLVDEIDRKLLELLNERSRLSQDFGRIKAHSGMQVLDESRERELMERLQRQNSGPLPQESLVRIWKEILRSSKELQSQKPESAQNGEGASK